MRIPTISSPPSLAQLSQIPKVLTGKERLWIRLLIILILISGISWGVLGWYKGAESVPAVGGTYSEGVVGQPRFINPILATTNDTDMDLSALIFSGLLTYDGQGNLVPDLAEKYEISEDQTSHFITLKENLRWHDDEPITSDDILFTIDTIQNPDMELSPLLRANWIGVKVEKVDERMVEFSLKKPYAPFAHNLTLRIIPQHIWEQIPPQNFPLAEFNIDPIGSGPFQMDKHSRGKDGRFVSIALKANPDYHNEGPYLEKFVVRFYPDFPALFEAYQRREVLGMHLIPTENASEVADRNSVAIHNLSTPAYFSIFLNQTRSEAIANKNLRKALALSIDKERLVNEVLSGNGTVIEYPILSDQIGFDGSISGRTYDPEAAKAALDAAGIKDSDEDGIVELDDEPLSFVLVTSNWPENETVVRYVAEEWRKLGIEIEVDPQDIGYLQQNTIRPRNYDMLLFGVTSGRDPDPWPIWHSSQTKDPGLNFALYKDKTVDEAITKARQTSDGSKRKEFYKTFLETIAEDIPAIFLYQPVHLYGVSEKIKGINISTITTPSDRFNMVNQWYMKTRLEGRNDN